MISTSNILHESNQKVKVTTCAVNIMKPSAFTEVVAKAYTEDEISETM